MQLISHAGAHRSVSRIKNPASQWFTMAFLAGSIVIVFSEMIPGGGSSFTAAFAVIMPVVIMVFYFIHLRNFAINNTLLSVSQVADSVYFLGFLFTLVSLISALAFISTIESTVVVSKFSLALITTIVGLFIKTVNSQFNAETDQGLDYSSTLLAESMENLAEQLNSVSLQIGETVVESQLRLSQTADECVNQISDRLNKNAQDYSHALSVQIDILKKQAELILKELSGTATDVLDKMASTQDDLTRTSKSLVVEFDGTSRRMKALAEQTDQAEGGLRAYTDSLQRTCSQLEKNEAFENNRIESSASIAATLSTLVQKLESLDRQLDACTDGVRQTNDSLCETLTTRLDKSVDSLSAEARKQGDVFRDKLDQVIEVLKSQHQLNQPGEQAHFTSLDQQSQARAPAPGFINRLRGRG